MDIQRLRNLTTGRLHTSIDDVMLDIEYLVGERGIMTHMLPLALPALLPYLKTVVTDPKFWDGAYDPTHVGEIDVRPMNWVEQAEFWKRYSAL